MKLSVLLCGALLMSFAGCSTQKSDVVVEQVPVVAPVPDYLLNCKDIPEVPEDVAKMPQINLFILDLYEAADDCKKKLTDTGRVLQQFKQNIAENFNGPK